MVHRKKLIMKEFNFEIKINPKSIKHTNAACLLGLLIDEKFDFPKSYKLGLYGKFQMFTHCILCKLRNHFTDKIAKNLCYSLGYPMSACPSILDSILSLPKKITCSPFKIYDNSSKTSLFSYKPP